MEEKLVSFSTAKLAKEKGFDISTNKYWCNFYIDEPFNIWKLLPTEELSISFMEFAAPTQSLLQKFIREKRGVHIEIHRNASGYYWSMCKADGGTDLGWSDISGPNDSGVWDSFEGALENALQVQLSYDLPNDITIIKHWGNYVEFALKSK